MTDLNLPSRVKRFVPAMRLLVLAAGISWVWLSYLPRWSEEPRMRSDLQIHIDRNINGAATFYTENPAAMTALHDLKQLQTEQPQLLWRW